VGKDIPLSKVLKEFETITSRGYHEVASYLPKDRVPIGFFCPYVPEELIHAAGALPFRLMGTPVKMSHVQAHLPPNCCHLVKSSLESLLQGELDFLKGNNLANKVHVVKDGAEALEYIFANGAYAHRKIEDQPRVILLDLKLPKVDIPVVVLTSSSEEFDIVIPVVVLTSSSEEFDIVYRDGKYHVYITKRGKYKTHVYIGAFSNLSFPGGNSQYLFSYSHCLKASKYFDSSQDSVSI
jgi:two-component system response regulator